MPISTIDDVWYRNAFVYGTWPEKSLAKSSYKNCLNSRPENDPSDMFLVVCVHLLLWFFLHFCGMLKVLVQLYFQVHYYDVSTVVWKSHKKSHFTLFASEATNETFCCRISNSIKYCLLHLLKGQNSTCKDSAHWCKHRRTSVCSTASAKYERPAKYPLNWCRYRFSEPVTKIKVETFFWPSSASSVVA